jgi:hypothetical protein
MIQTNELRIGNWLLDEHGKYFNVGSIQKNFHGVNINNKYPGLIEPIHLTNEILVQCGFENGVLGNFKIGYDGDDFVKQQFSVPFEDRLLKVKYLHQLQNLYYALTGKELSIDLTVQVSDTTKA